MAAHVLFIPLRETVCVSVHSECECHLPTVLGKIYSMCASETLCVRVNISVQLHSIISGYACSQSLGTAFK